MFKNWSLHDLFRPSQAHPVDRPQDENDVLGEKLIKMSDSQRWFLLVGVFALGWVLYLLGPVLTPFVVAAFLAYLGDPLVDRLEALKISRTLSVVTVFATLTLSGLLLMVFLVPILEHQLQTLISNLPLAIEWAQQRLLPKLLASPLFNDSSFDSEAIRRVVVEHWQELAGTMTEVIRRVTVSGQVLLAWLLDAVLVPVVTFYLLRDWDLLVAHVRHLLPRRYEPVVVKLVGECDEVLAGFLRGQLMVMLALAIIYTIGLWLVGLKLAFSIGVMAGLVSFVPYLGFVVGITVAGLAVIVQFQDPIYLAYVAAVFVSAELIQGFVLSPWLVGERVGLHPVTVIFAVLAGGQLFGFVGVLLGLPVAAVIVVLLRHSRDLYFKSDLYTP
jgi:predicted PurR-regulated permease PerM